MLQADLTDELEVDRLFEEARRRSADRRLRRRRRRLAREDVPVWQLPLERWEQTLAQNLTLLVPHRRALPPRGRAERPRLARPRRLDGRDRRRGRARRLRGREVGVLGGLLLSLKNEVVRVAPSRRVNAVAPGWTESPMTRGTSTRRPSGESRATMALRKVASPRTSPRRSSCSPRTSSPATSPARSSTVAGGMEGRVVHDDLGTRKAAAGAAVSKLPRRRMIAVSPRPESRLRIGTSRRT
jgi:3-oxoacyl-[acyl-carrier protein] reductase